MREMRNSFQGGDDDDDDDRGGGRGPLPPDDQPEDDGVDDDASFDELSHGADSEAPSGRDRESVGATERG
jgi:hypothetical protein